MEINYKAVGASITMIILGIGILSRGDTTAGMIITGAGVVTSLEILKWISSAWDLIRNLLRDEKKNEQIITNSQDSNQIQAGRDVIFIKGDMSKKDIEKLIKNKNVKNIKETIKEESFEKIEGVEDKAVNYNESKKLLKKIYSYLDESQSISNIANMALRLCSDLRMKDYLEWLKNEVYGYEEMNYEGPLDYKKRNFKYPDYRRINVELHTLTREGTKNELDLKFFVPQPLESIENWISTANSNQLILGMPPLKIFVDELNVNPNEKVPYIVQINALRNILTSFKIDLNKFLMEAKKKIEEHNKYVL